MAYQAGTAGATHLLGRTSFRLADKGLYRPITLHFFPMHSRCGTHIRRKCFWINLTSISLKYEIFQKTPSYCLLNFFITFDIKTLYHRKSCV